jgi:hypothetical protein
MAQAGQVGRDLCKVLQLQAAKLPAAKLPAHHFQQLG